MKLALLSVVLLASAARAAKPAKPSAPPAELTVKTLALDSRPAASVAEWTKRAADAVKSAAKDGADMVVFPEGFASPLGTLAGPGADAASFATRAVEDQLMPALKAAAEGKTAVVLGGYPRAGAGDPTWRFAILDAGRWSWSDKTDLSPADAAALPGAKPGYSLVVLRRAGGVWAVVPALTLEKTEVANQLKRRAPQLLVVPSPAADPVDGARLLRIASGRAAELGAAVLVVAPSGASLYVPAQKGFDQGDSSAGGDAAFRVPWKKLLELRSPDAHVGETRPFLEPTGLRQVEM